MAGLIEFSFTLHGAHQKKAFVWEVILQAQSTPTDLPETELYFFPCPVQLTSEEKVNRLCEVEKKRKQALHSNSSHVLATLIQNVINIQLQEFRKV